MNRFVLRSLKVGSREKVIKIFYVNRLFKIPLNRFGDLVVLVIVILKLSKELKLLLCLGQYRLPSWCPGFDYRGQRASKGLDV